MDKKNIKCLQLDHPNQNGRIYPRAVIEKALQDYMPTIHSLASYGCFVSDIGGSMQIPLDKITHVVVDGRIVGDYLECDIQILSTSYGAVLSAIIDDPSVQFGPRGFGIVDIKTGLVSNYTFHSINVFMESPADRAKQQRQSANYAYQRAMGIIKK
jgi:hypothetical protein